LQQHEKDLFWRVALLANKQRRMISSGSLGAENVRRVPGRLGFVVPSSNQLPQPTTNATSNPLNPHFSPSCVVDGAEGNVESSSGGGGSGDNDRNDRRNETGEGIQQPFSEIDGRELTSTLYPLLVFNCPKEGRPYFVRKGLESSTTSWDVPSSRERPVNLAPGWEIRESVHTKEMFFRNEDLDASSRDAPISPDSIVTYPRTPPPGGFRTTPGGRTKSLGERSPHRKVARFDPLLQPPQETLLPPGWKSVYSHSVGTFYYVHESGKSSWEVPVSGV